MDWVYFLFLNSTLEVSISSSEDSTQYFSISFISIILSQDDYNGNAEKNQEDEKLVWHSKSKKCLNRR